MGCVKSLVDSELHSTVETFLEIEVSVGVVVRDVLDHLVEECHLALRELSVLDIFSDKVAEDSSEVLVARI